MIRTETDVRENIRFLFNIRESGWYSGSYDVGIATRDNVGVNCVEPLILKRVKDGELTEPSARLTKEDLQIMFNELWRIGFRPQDGTGNGGHIDALKYHLEDMRKLVFKVK